MDGRSKARRLAAPYPPSDGSFDEIGLLVSLHPISEPVGIPRVVQQLSQTGQGIERHLARSFQILPSLIGPFIDLETQPIQRYDPIWFVVLRAYPLVATPRRLAHRL